MGSLLLKDLDAARRALWLIMPLGILQLAVFASVGPMLVPGAALLAAILAFGSIPVEELQGTEALWNSLPVNRRQIVVARYVTTLLGLLVGLGLSWTIGQLIAGQMRTPTLSSLPLVSLTAHAALFATLALASALYLPFCFRMGAGRALLPFAVVGLAATVLLVVATGFVTDLSVASFDPSAWSETAARWQAEAEPWLASRWPQILGALVIPSLCALGLSAFVSWRLYETRDP